MEKYALPLITRPPEPMDGAYGSEEADNQPDLDDTDEKKSDDEQSEGGDDDE
ncbi:hypothetical protein KJ359_004869 [Pestalotiopsis sp. 9143b]|nr:hypothetical protein KJ359_004869 [Pestalotiopsis sp. 9143b]